MPLYSTLVPVCQSLNMFRAHFRPSSGDDGRYDLAEETTSRYNLLPHQMLPVQPNFVIS
jgi:hypothetical protein